MVFERFQQYGLRINVSKSVMGAAQVEYLGFLITAEGSRPLPEKVQAILSYKLPETIHDLRTFLGIINFYRRYLKDAAKTQAPLHELLKGAKKKDRRKVHWTDDTRRSFEKCKINLAEAALLSFPRSGLPLSLCTDASDFAVGAVLQQLENESWKPIAFYSKKLNETQTRYSTYDRELLGIYLSVKHFKHLLEGNDFVIYTDHKPLTFAFKQKNEKTSTRQQRQLQYISEFSCNIQHVLGKDNVVADALSRIDSISENNFEEIAEEQTTDEELQKLLHNNSLKFKPSTLPPGKKLWCDILTQKIRPYIPQKFRFQIFQLIHGLAHPGIKSTVKLMTEKYVWSDIKKQVREWAKACIRCQKCKVSRHTKSKLGEFEQPDERFSVVHIDLIGKLPPSEGMQYCLTCIDRFSCWMEAIPIPEITAEIVGRAFYEKWICRFGVPAKLVTDQGRQFEAELFRSIAAICGAKVAHTTSYHPQCNGKVERLHRTLKGAIKAHNNIRWTESLHTVLLGLRAAIRPDISYTIAQMVYGTSIKLPGEFFDPPTINMDPQNFVAKLQQHMAELKPLKSPSNRKQNIFVHKDLKSCSHVFLRIDRVKKALEPPYEGPYTVQKRSQSQRKNLRIEEQKEKLRIEEREEKLRFEQLRLDEQKRKDEVELEKLRIQLGTDTSKESDTKFLVKEISKFIHRFDLKEDISLYLKLFERQAQRLNIDQENWVSHLLGLLPTEVSHIIARGPDDKANSYEHVKDLLLKRFKLTPEKFRQLFVTHQKSPERTWIDFYHELNTYFNGWIDGLKIDTFNKLSDLIITDQLKRKTPFEFKEYYLDEWANMNSPLFN
ncbi:transposon Tf2-6 polyprotein [Trichonephila clavipes]|nr:transposon Tf2-6 polyprotein [Trichonephila clavipes]